MTNYILCKQKILVVDDMSDNIQLLYHILQDEYQVYYATNGTDALQSTTEKQPDLILLDVTMPGMDGFSVCKQLKSNVETQAIPVIFITASGESAAEIEGFSCGAVDFITKPVNPSIVRVRVQTHLALQRQKKDLQQANDQLLKEMQKREFLEQKLREQAEFDGLTKLPNRKLFHDRLEQSILLGKRTKHSFALMFIDLDRFKWVNDTLGHAAGDELLVEVAQRLSEVVRESDTVARLGGDEFTIILLDIMHNSMADLVAQKILEQMSKPFILKNQEVKISCSLGIATFPHNGFTSEMLLKNADSAMYQAKESGRNAFQFYSADMNQRIHKHLKRKDELFNAIQKQELFLEFQPKIRIESGKIIGMEALLRWNHPDDGIIYPKAIIPLAEETGLIIEIGAWVLQTACQQAARWRQAGYTQLKLAVNISVIQFREGESFVKIVKDTLQNTDLPANALELEVTESMMVGDLDLAFSILTQLQDMGITISLDDFGTGYSSLAVLKRLPVQTLKIDRSFVTHLECDPHGIAFISAITSMAKQLGLQIIAEGVESQAQLKIIQDHGGDDVQGFYYCPPIGKEAFLALLQGGIPLGGTA